MVWCLPPVHFKVCVCGMLKVLSNFNLLTIICITKGWQYCNKNPWRWSDNSKTYVGDYSYRITITEFELLNDKLCKQLINLMQFRRLLTMFKYLKLIEYNYWNADYFIYCAFFLSPLLFWLYGYTHSQTRINTYWNSFRCNYCYLLRCWKVIQKHLAGCWMSTTLNKTSRP